MPFRKSLLAKLLAHINDSTVHIAALTGNRAVATDASGALVAAAPSDTELGYLDGVTSSVQTQIDGKAASSHTHAASDISSGQLALARGGTAANLTDPNADRILFWDDSAGQMTFLTVGSGLTITGTNMTTSGGSGTEQNFDQGDGGGDFTTTSTSLVDLTGASITNANATAGDLDMNLVCTHYNSGAANYNYFVFDVDGTDYGDQYMRVKTANSEANMALHHQLAVTAASHTVKVQVKVDAGTGTIVNGAAVNWKFSAVKYKT